MYKMVTSILLKILSLNWDISTTIWPIEVTDGSFFNFSRFFNWAEHFFDRNFPLNVAHKGLKTRKWHDIDCETAKKEVLIDAKSLQIYSKDPTVRGKYHDLKTDYKLLVKYKEHSFHKTMLQRISQLESNDPKIFWQMVKKLKTNRDKNLTDNINPLEWLEWFKKLNIPQSTPCGYDKIIDSIIKRAKDFTTSNDILDKGISNIEIIKVSKHLKKGKAVRWWCCYL